MTYNRAGRRFDVVIGARRHHQGTPLLYRRAVLGQRLMQDQDTAVSQCQSGKRRSPSCGRELPIPLFSAAERAKMPWYFEFFAIAGDPMSDTSLGAGAPLPDADEFNEPFRPRYEGARGHTWEELPMRKGV